MSQLSLKWSIVCIRIRFVNGMENHINKITNYEKHWNKTNNKTQTITYIHIHTTTDIHRYTNTYTIDINTHNTHNTNTQHTHTHTFLVFFRLRFLLEDVRVCVSERRGAGERKTQWMMLSMISWHRYVARSFSINLRIRVGFLRLRGGLWGLVFH